MNLLLGRLNLIMIIIQNDSTCHLGRDIISHDGLKLEI